MPGYILHLTEAQFFIEAISSAIAKESYCNRITPEWSNAFLCGALLPDAVLEDKSESHFWDKLIATPVFQIPNLEYFKQSYKVDLDNPLLCGYYVHLHLDFVFFKYFMPKYVRFFDENGKPTELSKYAHSVLLRKSGEIISLDKFFSESYLYGDYTKLNAMLISRYALKRPDYHAIERESCCDVSVANLEHVLEELDTFLATPVGSEMDTAVLAPDELIEFLKISAVQAVEYITERGKI